jgi:membrane-associated phospholipid phosphatase
MHENRHYFSDVVFGAGIGVATGLTVTRHIGRGGWTIAPVLTPGAAAVVVRRAG